MSAHSPLIIVGMHRSGTSMLCESLSKLGIFFGSDKTEVNRESSFFLHINRWLFDQCGATWDRPDAVRELFDHEAFYGDVRSYVIKVLRSPYADRFLGRHKSRGFEGIDKPWGWKDPRNTFTLPLWAELFPGAKILSVDRNGVDVAQSLKTRENRRLESKRQAIAAGKITNRRQLFPSKLHYQKMLRLTMSLRCLSLEGGFSLWESYVAEAHAQVARHQGPAMTVRYEDLLANPRHELAKICAFCEISVAEGPLDEVVAGLRVERANAYATHPELQRFYEDHRDRLAKYGY